MKVQTKLFLTGLSPILLLTAIGCGGGGSTTTDSGTVSKATYTVSGTVPGTLIEAFCKDGSYYKVNSTDNNTTQHPFTLTLPSGVNCKFVMTTNEKDPDSTQHIVTPLLINDGNSTSSYFELSDDVDLGYVPLSLTSSGVQTPIQLAVSHANIRVNIFSFDPLDKDNDGIPNVYEDDDNDGIVNVHDKDDDGDGIDDINDSDHTNDRDGDGIDNEYDEDSDNNNTTINTDTNTTTLTTSFKADSGRLLGSQCAQCHGTDGVSTNSWDSIAGESDLIDEIYDDEPIMSAQAHGYTSEEIVLMGNWLKTLQKNDD